MTARTYVTIDKDQFDAACALLLELAEDLGSELNARYGAGPKYASEERRYNRDMAVVLRAQELLSEFDHHPPTSDGEGE